MTKYTDLCACPVCVTAQKYCDNGLPQSEVNEFMQLSTQFINAKYSEQLNREIAEHLDNELAIYLRRKTVSKVMIERGVLTTGELMDAMMQAVQGNPEHNSSLMARIDAYGAKQAMN